MVILYIQRKIFFRATIFLYSPCPNLQGIKDALSYKFRRVTIGQNSCAVCTNEVARAKREGISALCHGLVVDSTFERSENFATVRYTAWPTVRGVVYTMIVRCSFHLRMRIALTGTRIVSQGITVSQLLDMDSIEYCGVTMPLGLY